MRRLGGGIVNSGSGRGGCAEAGVGRLRSEWRLDERTGLSSTYGKRRARIESKLTESPCVLVTGNCLLLLLEILLVAASGVALRDVEAPAGAGTGFSKLTLVQRQFSP